MTATSLDLSQIRTDALASAASFRTLIGVYSESEVDSLISGKADTSHTHDLSDLTQSGATTGQVLQWDGSEWVPATVSGGGGSGDVVGPASSTDNAIARFDSTTGKLLQNSSATVDDSGHIRSDRVNFGANSWIRSRTLSTSGDSLVFGLGGSDSIYLNNDGLFAGANSSYTMSRADSLYAGTYALSESLDGRSFGIKGTSGAGFLLRCTSGATYYIDSNSSSQLTVGSGSGNAFKCESAGDVAFTKQVRLGLYTFATVPTASSFTGYLITISDRSYRSAYSDGTNWRFVSDDAIIS